MKSQPSAKSSRNKSASMRSEPKGPTTQATEKIQLSPDEVAYRAYLNFEKHGSADGSDVRDWLQAEAELGIEHAHAGKD